MLGQSLHVFDALSLIHYISFHHEFGDALFLRSIKDLPYLSKILQKLFQILG
jgi:hypothetical protein